MLFYFMLFYFIILNGMLVLPIFTIVISLYTFLIIIYHLYKCINKLSIKYNIDTYITR